MISGNNREQSFVYKDRKLAELAETFLFKTELFLTQKYYELNTVGDRAWPHKCFACKTRSSVHAKVCKSGFERVGGWGDEYVCKESNWNREKKNSIGRKTTHRDETLLLINAGVKYVAPGLTRSELVFALKSQSQR